MNITTIGIDLAKSLFQIHGVDERSRTVLRKSVKRAELTKLLANLPSVRDRVRGLRERALLGGAAD